MLPSPADPAGLTVTLVVLEDIFHHLAKARTYLVNMNAACSCPEFRFPRSRPLNRYLLLQETCRSEVCNCHDHRNHLLSELASPFVNSEGFAADISVDSLAAFEMFSQTPHVEIVARLSSDDASRLGDWPPADQRTPWHNTIKL